MLALLACLGGAQAVLAQAPAPTWGSDPVPDAPFYGPPGGSCPAPVAYPAMEPPPGPPPVPANLPNAWACSHTPPEVPRPLFISAEGLLWWMKPAPLSTPLVTTGSLADDVPGAIGQPNTVVLFGDQGLGEQVLSGARLTVGFAPDGGRSASFEVSGFWVGQFSHNFSAQSDSTGQPLLARPIFDLEPGGAEDSFLYSAPALGVGGIFVTSSSQMWDVEPQLIMNVAGNDSLRLDMSLGFRYTDLKEDMRITSTTTSLDPTYPAFFAGNQLNVGDSTVVVDEFKTNNAFYGGQIGGADGI